MTLLRSTALLAAALLTSHAHAMLVASDDFSYPNGALTTVSGGTWTTHSGTSGTLAVSGGQAVVSQDSGSEDASLTFATVSSGSLYYAVDFSIPSSGGAFSGSDFEYFAHFMAPTGSTFRGRVDAVAPNGGGDFSLGIATEDSAADSVWATDLSFDTSYTAVVELNIDDGGATLWVDPTSESDTSIDGESAALPSIGRFALRQSNSSSDETILVDAVRIGTTFDSVVSVAAIPEPTSMFFGTLLATGVSISAARRKR
ncbi:MAG: hypothetical protein AAGJ46_03030 [Planctomycetota bacterium]